VAVIFAIWFSLGAFAAGEPSATDEWQFSTPEAQGMQSGMLVDMMAHITHRGFMIDSLLIVRNGHIVMDTYFAPFKQGNKHGIYSCTKSVISALIGIAIDKGYIKSVHQPIIDFFPEAVFANADDLKKSITIEDLLMMASGLQCRDSYLYLWQGLMEMRSSDNWAQYVLDLPMEGPPGEKFEYCNGVSHLLSVIIQNATHMRTLAFARQHLFGPLGITDIGWETSPQGVDIGYGEMRLQPHDMAKFGWLYLQMGRWGNQQIVPSDWVARSTRRHIDATLFDYYGYQWWGDDDGYYMAVGYKGQRIFVVPPKNMVVVFTGDLTGGDGLISKALLDAYIISAAATDQSLPANPEAHDRLQQLISSVATEPPEGTTWISLGNGVAKDGIFTRTVSPAFTFRYPFGSRKAGLDFPGEVMKMKTLGDIKFSAYVGEIPGDTPLKDFGPKIYAHQLENVGSQINVISNKAITLECGTAAYRTDIKWVWRNAMPIITFLVSAYKDDQLVYVCAHPWRDHHYAEPIVMSLRFN
jgi:CubicO group peptidase (beta-lactamase class C family)